MRKITDFIIKNNIKKKKFIMINTTYYSVYEIVKEIEDLLRAKGIFVLRKRGYLVKLSRPVLSNVLER